jgi:hypothetical protein
VGDVDARAILLDADPDFPVLMINVPREKVDEAGEIPRRTQLPDSRVPSSPRVVSHCTPEGPPR